MYFDKIAFTYAGQSQLFSWHRRKGRVWKNSELDPLPLSKSVHERREHRRGFRSVDIDVNDREDSRR